QAQAQHAAERAALAGQVADLERRAAFASGPATVVFTLRPPAGAPQPLARGKLWVAADHQHWQLDVTGLEATPPGREYQVWFLVDGYPFNGGCFALEKGRVGGRFDAHMPAGTQAVSVTLERAGGAPRPTSPVLLVAEEAVEL
ncbi:MAG: anti-sigma factor, partial [Thermoanaerobaculia bacterium]